MAVETNLVLDKMVEYRVSIMPADATFRFLEIGTASGKTTQRIIQLLKKIRVKNFEVYACDPFVSYWEKEGRNEEETYKKFLEMNGSEIDNGILTFERASSEEFLTKLRHKNGKNFFDVVFIDGAHDAYSVIKDFILSDILLKLHGYIIFDDYAWISKIEKKGIIEEGLPRHPAYSPVASIDFIKNILTINYRYEISNGTPVMAKVRE